MATVKIFCSFLKAKLLTLNKIGKTSRIRSNF